MLLYGETPESFYGKHETIDENTGELRPMTLEDAQGVFDKYFAGKPAIKKLIDKSKEDLERLGYVELPSGFRRILPGVYSKDFRTKNKALRQSLNSSIQGTSAYITQAALKYIDRFLRESKIDARICLTVHDSVSLSTTQELIPTVVNAVEYIMRHLPLDFLTIPMSDGTQQYVNMDVESEVGSNYGEETDYDEEEYKTFNSMKGYTEYHKAKKYIKDELSEKYLTEEEADEKYAELDTHKPEYQAM